MDNSNWASPGSLRRTVNLGIECLPRRSFVGMWNELNQRLTKSYQFESFAEAFAFLTEVARLAELHDHHPTIHNVHVHVRLELTTHDAGNTITDRDHQLAAAIDAIPARAK